jgi:hypothetical protein
VLRLRQAFGDRRLLFFAILCEPMPMTDKRPPMTDL